MTRASSPVSPCLWMAAFWPDDRLLQRFAPVRARLTGAVLPGSQVPPFSRTLVETSCDESTSVGSVRSFVQMDPCRAGLVSMRVACLCKIAVCQDGAARQTGQIDTTPEALSRDSLPPTYERADPGRGPSVPASPKQNRANKQRAPHRAPNRDPPPGTRRGSSADEPKRR